MTAATAPRPRALVAYYSRSGNTRRVAETIAAELGADLEPITDLTGRRGFWGYLRAGRDAMRGRGTTIGAPVHDPAAYDLVVVGTPVWASSMTPAVRTWLGRVAGRLPEAALFLTHGGTGRERVFSQLTALCGRFPLGALALREQELKAGNWEPRARAFAREILTLAEHHRAAGAEAHAHP
ncbi:MAG TPA: flavodoxin [Gemmatimonadales bacterium]|nr:flavodoxin [Gemmatimonadales bacterium]